MDDHKRKFIVLCVSSIMLVAMVIAIIYINTEDEENQQGDDVSASRKAITTICDTTDYKETCVESLKSAGTNSSDPRELIQLVFQAAVGYINGAANKSIVFQNLEKDPRAKSALETCNELARRAIGDLQRSLAKFNNFDIIHVEDILLDLKIWISGAITHQETCLDGFQGVKGDAGQRMKDALETSMKMSSNVLAMVEELSTYLQAMGVENMNTRRLLSVGDNGEEHHSDRFPEWMDSNTRKLLSSSPRQIRPNLIVAKDGSGKHMTINEALKAIPATRHGVFVLYIKQGVYEENVKITSNLTNLLIIGDGPNKTRITGKLNYVDGIGTYHTATVAVHGDGFIARNIGFENAAGPEKHQAVALRVSADKAIFHNCRMDGYQDTLYTHAYRQFYRSCTISGTIDFIFGDAAVVFQRCTMLIRKPLDNQQCIVTAQGRKDMRQPTGLVLQNCTIKAADDYYPVKEKVKSYLGRPWKQYSRTIVMESFIDDVIQPEGWLPWDGAFAIDTLFYTEFNNVGPAAHKTERVKWPGVKELPPDRIKRFTAAEFLDGNRWIPPRKVPYSPGFMFPLPKEDPSVKYSPVVPEETKDLGSQPIVSSPEKEPPPPGAGSVAAPAPAPQINSPASDQETLIVASPVASPIADAVFIPPIETTYTTPPVLVPASAPQLGSSPAAAPAFYPPAFAPDTFIGSPNSGPAVAPATDPNVDLLNPASTSVTTVDPPLSPSSNLGLAPLSDSPMAPPSVSPGASPQSSDTESYINNAGAGAGAPSPVDDISPNGDPFLSPGSFGEGSMVSALPPRPHHQSDVAAAPPLASFVFADALS